MGDFMFIYKGKTVKVLLLSFLCFFLVSCRERKLVFNINDNAWRQDNTKTSGTEKSSVGISKKENAVNSKTSSTSATSVTSTTGGNSATEFTDEKVNSNSSNNVQEKQFPQFPKKKHKKKTKNIKITATTKIVDVIKSIDDYFGNLIFPQKSDLQLRDVRKLLKWDHYIYEKDTVDVVNYIIKNKDNIFYDIYSDKEKEKDENLKNTGLFFFKGKKKAKTAIICPGGDFTYLSTVHDGFPQALELSKRGYNAFVLIYRKDKKMAAMDLARAVAFLHEYKKELGINIKKYSVWGAGAGGNLAIWLGNYGTEVLGEKKYPKPGAIVTQYTDWYDVGKERPTFASVGTADGIANPSKIEKRIKKIKKKGIDAEFYLYRGMAHGFGLARNYRCGVWFGNAIKFWERAVNK